MSRSRLHPAEANILVDSTDITKGSGEKWGIKGKRGKGTGKREW